MTSTSLGLCLMALAHGQAQPTAQANARALKELSDGFRHSVEPVLPAVVTVEVLRGPKNMPSWVMGAESTNSNHPHDPRVNEKGCPRDGTGSGLIIDRRGYVLTCNHVVESADVVRVRLGDGRRLEAIQIHSDPVMDLAVIQVSSGKPLPEAPLGNSDELRIGDWVASIGNPYELGLSISAGIVSTTDRHLHTSPRSHLIQTDAASNPGNSGGALVNLRGQVVGISEGGYGVHEGFQGIGFAIPINPAIKIAKRLIEEGKVRHVRLDFDTQPLEPHLADYLGIEQDGGLLVCMVVPNSSAARAGLRVGDVLTSIDSSRVQNHCDVVSAIEDAAPDLPLPVTLVRNGESRSIELIPESMEIGLTDQLQAHEVEQATAKSADWQYGLAVDEKSASELKRLGFDQLPRAVVVTNVSADSAAAKEGVCAGMLLLRVGNESVENLAEYESALKDIRDQAQVLVLFATPEQQHFVLLQSRQK